MDVPKVSAESAKCYVLELEVAVFHLRTSVLNIGSEVRYQKFVVLGWIAC